MGVASAYYICILSVDLKINVYVPREVKTYLLTSGIGVVEDKVDVGIKKKKIQFCPKVVRVFFICVQEIVVFVDSLACGEINKVEPLLQNTMNKAEQGEFKYMLPEIYRLWAEYCLAKQQFEEAEQYIDRALEDTWPPEEGTGLMIKGQILFETGEIDDAIPLYEQSIKSLEGFPYETARTETTLGRALMAKGNYDEGKEFLLI